MSFYKIIILLDSDQLYNIIKKCQVNLGANLFNDKKYPDLWKKTAHYYYLSWN